MLFNYDVAPQPKEWSLQWKSWLALLRDKLVEWTADLSSNTAEILDLLMVRGDAFIEGGLDIEGDLSADDAAFEGDVNIAGDTDISGDLVVAGDTAGSAGLNLQSTVTLTATTTQDFPIPAWATRTTAVLRGVSTNGTATIRFRPMVASVAQTSGYLGHSASTTAVSLINFTAGFDGANASAAATRYGRFILTKVSPTVYMGEMFFGRSDAASGEYGVGTVVVSGTVTGLQLTTSNGTDLLDAGGEVTIIYE